jgi:hypothetical protein
MQKIGAMALFGLSLLGSACAQTALEIKSAGIVSTIKMKGDYESAAYCFSREWRNNWKSTRPQDYGSVEVYKDLKFAEYVVMPRWIVKFRNTEDGNSIAEIYISTNITCRSCVDRYQREYTANWRIGN